MSAAQDCYISIEITIFMCSNQDSRDHFVHGLELSFELDQAGGPDYSAPLNRGGLLVQWRQGLLPGQVESDFKQGFVKTMVSVQMECLHRGIIPFELFH